LLQTKRAALGRPFFRRGGATPTSLLVAMPARVGSSKKPDFPALSGLTYPDRIDRYATLYGRR
jgi:hypothetical protein